MAETECKYHAEKPEWEHKDWLYEHYWGRMLSLEEMAEKCNASQRTIGCSMKRLGIPRRGNRWNSGDEPYDPRNDWWLESTSPSEVADDDELSWGDVS